MILIFLINFFFCGCCFFLQQLYHSAIIGFQECATLVKQSFGGTSHEAITLFIFMCEACTFNKDVGMAYNSLNMATFELRALEKVAKEEDLNYTKALLFKVQGLICMMEENYSDATFNFAECIYYCAERFGGLNVRTCFGYYYLGLSFLSSDRSVDGMTMIGFCVELWMSYLEDLFHRGEPEDHMDTGRPLLDEVDASLIMPRFFQLEARQHLNNIEAVIKNSGDENIALMVGLCHALLDFLNERYKSAKELARLLQAGIPIEKADQHHGQLAKRIERVATRREWQVDSNRYSKVM